MNNLTVKFDLNSIIKMLIWFMNKNYWFFIPVCYIQLYLLPFFYRLRLPFSLPVIKIIANANKLTKAKERNLLITAHCTLTSVWPSCFLRGQVCCTDYRQQNGVHATVSLGLNFRTRLHSTLRKKEEKRKFWGRLVDRWQAVPLQSVESKLDRTGESEMAEGELPLGFLFFTSTHLAPFPRSHDHPGDCSQSNLWKV